MNQQADSCKCLDPGYHFAVKIYFGGRNSRLDASVGDISSPAAVSLLLGHAVCASESDDPDVAIFVDYDPKERPKLKDLKLMGVPLVLIKQEPVVTAPLHAKGNPSGLFDLVITRGDPDSDPIFNTFQEWDTRFVNQKERLERIVAINANKWSAIAGELYSLRRVGYSFDSRIDVYGRGWAESKGSTAVRVLKEIFIALRFGAFPQLLNIKSAFHQPANYLGEVDDKMLALASYKVSLVIENCDSYLSEKLVDALLAGCIPVYVGADPTKFGIPENLFIKSDANVEAIKRSLEIALNMSHEDFLLRVQSWVEQPETRSKWESVQVFSRILEHIDRKFAISPGEAG